MAFTKQYTHFLLTLSFFSSLFSRIENSQNHLLLLYYYTILLLYYSAIHSFSLELNELITIECVEATSGDSLSKQISNNAPQKNISSIKI